MFGEEFFMFQTTGTLGGVVTVKYAGSEVTQTVK